MVSWVVIWLLAMTSLVHSLPVGTCGLRLLSRDGLSSLRPPSDLIGLKKSGKQRTESSALWLGEKRPEIFPLEDSEKPDDADDDQEEYDDESEEGPPEEPGEASGRFKLKPSKQPMIFNTGELPPPPVFRGPRNIRTTSASDNLIVIGLTIFILAASVSFFLWINKDLPDRPPPPPMRF